MRPATSTFVGALIIVVLPVVAVLLVDKRCLYTEWGWWNDGLDSHSTNVNIKHCAEHFATGGCEVWTDAFTSKYRCSYDTMAASLFQR